ncbi:hypothetical protein LPW11_02485 [Geomonas sp. RF6]|uniref:hypothetical protein n=1 Tax=Geomonas sp. RF6 TaxID=2897342 RepID=UPI001E64E425|nr:hypothetical protein [Geomonas sp. RF6]UFS71065.1 hypothetical protein LPW11_02485 [Geomonas sp. RF6]
MVVRRTGRIHGKALVMFPLLALLLAGCAGQKKAQTGPIFFPPEPNPPRIQYLKGINGSKDIVKEKLGFSVVSLGKEEEDVVKNIAKPYGITAEKGKLYVVDTILNEVYIADVAAQSFVSLPGNKGQGKMKKPINIAVAKDGNVFVADTFRKEILMYDVNGNFVQGFGKDLDMKPVDCVVDDENIYALDFSHNDIKVISRATGELARTIGKSTETEQGLSMPTNLTLDSKGFIYVTNTGSGRVIKLDRDGHIVSSFGKMGDAFSEFGRPRGIAVDDAGRIYVADASHQNIQIFNDKGRLLMFFGDPGLVEGSLNLPAGVTTTKENLEYYQKLADPNFVLENVIFVTNQFGPVKVAVYGLGHMKGQKVIGNYGEGAEQPKKAAPKASETSQK